ncbi:bcl-2-like protein 1 [Amia ocellicauda]|uniref:bcl-2-like protein 1 n=1 Tax=Amia ocellicauda TaxID=2972642 RepID=UPI00346447AD
MNLPCSNRELVVLYIFSKLYQNNGTWKQLMLEAASEPTMPEVEVRVNRDVLQALLDFDDEFDEIHDLGELGTRLYELHASHLMPCRIFETVADEFFIDGVSWARIAKLFDIAGLLCMESAEKVMNPSIGRIVNLLTDLLDNNLNHWIRRHGGWNRFADLYGEEAAERRKSKASLKKWILGGVTLVTGLAVGFLIGRMWDSVMSTPSR